MTCTPRHPATALCRCGRRGPAIRLAGKLSCVLAVRLADLRAYFLNASVLSVRPVLLAPGAAAARRCAACRGAAAAPDRRSSEDSAAEELLDTEDEPGTPPPPARRLGLAQVPAPPPRLQPRSSASMMLVFGLCMCGCVCEGALDVSRVTQPCLPPYLPLEGSKALGGRFGLQQGGGALPSIP